MLNDGLLVQRINRDDYRAMLLDFSESGWRAFARARPAIRAHQTRVTEALASEESESLFSVLDKIEAITLPQECAATCW